MLDSRSRSIRTRTYRLLIIYACASIPFIAFGAAQAMRTNSNSPLDWVSSSFPPRADYEKHVEQFGSGDLVFASWPTCTIDEPRLDVLVEILRTHDAFRDNRGRPYFDRVSCGRDLVTQLTRTAHLPADVDAARRLQGTVVGPDYGHTCVVIGFCKPALKHRARIVKLITSCIYQVCDVSRDDLHLAGPVIDGLVVDQAGRSSLVRLAVPSAVAVFVLACVCLGSLRTGGTVFALSVFCQGATLAMVHYCGESMNALLIVLPPLIQVLSVAGGVHLTNYYFDAVSERGTGAPVAEAVKIGWLPCVLSAGTTALGIGSLAFSELIPIRSFGIYGLIGVLLSAGVMLLLAPAVWEIWPSRSRPTPRCSTMDTSPSQNSSSHWVTRHWGAILAAFAMIMVAASWSLPNIQTSVRIETLFSPGSRILTDYAWIEDRVGPLVPIDIVVSWPVDALPPVADRIKTVSQLQHAAINVPEVEATLSAVQFLPGMFASGEENGHTVTPVSAEELEATLTSLVDTGLVARRDGRELWRVTARVSSLAPLDYNDVLTRLRRHIRTDLDMAQQTHGGEIHLTGIMPLVHDIQRLMLSDLMRSFASAILTITIIMTVAQGGIVAGLVAMIPNVCPIIFLFGVLGWQQIPLDLGTIMTASVALGIAVDDTLHFLNSFQRGIARGLLRCQAVHFAYRQCSSAMIQTSIICVAGMLVFTLSEFSPTSRFAWMTSGLIAVTLAADLLLLPSLLVSPLGYWFAPGKVVDFGDVSLEPDPVVVSAIRPVQSSAKSA